MSGSSGIDEMEVGLRQRNFRDGTVAADLLTQFGRISNQNDIDGVGRRECAIDHRLHRR